MKTIYIGLKNNYSIPNSYLLPSDEIKPLMGANSGNLVFRKGLHQIINSQRFEMYDFMSEVQQTEKIDKAVLSCANWISDRDLNEKNNLIFYNFLRKLDCQIIPVGLGVQAWSNLKPVPLKKNTLNLIKLLSERAPLISVRDQFTQETLEKYGVHNTVITGCPSNFINLDKDLPLKIKEQSEKLLNKKRSALTFAISEHSETENNLELKHTLKFLKQTYSHYILQTPNMISFLRDNLKLPDLYEALGTSRVFNPISQIEGLLRSTSKFFLNTDSWLEFARSVDLSFGMRLHGNICMLQAGTPSLIVYHDTRTEGLADTMKLPKISNHDFLKTDLNLIHQIILEKNILGTQDFLITRKLLHKRFSDFFEAHQIQTTTKFKNMYKNLNFINSKTEKKQELTNQN